METVTQHRQGADRGRTWRTWTRAAAARLHAEQRRRGVTPVPAGWIVRMTGAVPADPRAIAAGPTAREALALAREIGHGEGRQAWPADAGELEALDLPPSALGVVEDAVPWWREPDTAAVTRTVPLKVDGAGRVYLAHPAATIGECRGGGYIVAVDDVPDDVRPAAVLRRYAALIVRWRLADPADRRLSWRAIANAGAGAIVRPEAGGAP